MLGKYIPIKCNNMKVITNYRYWLLFIICGVALIALFAVPVDELPLLTWLWVLVSSKALAAAAFYLFHVLYERWTERGTIQELNDFIENF